ncbi:MAG: hypothetical protein Q4C10_10420 [Clostridia bacterium]|nr:hypothetical protein [Clostridia bacterium]
METVLREVDAVAAYKALSPKDALVLRLLAEETMAMVRAITGSVKGEFWIEDLDGMYGVHLKVDTMIDAKKREELLSASTSGKNEATRGFMGKIRAFFQPTSSVPMFSSGFVGGAPQMYGNYEWSMEDYREQLRQYREQNAKSAQEAWDELEKSVVAHVADDVKVSILGRTVEMTILKKMA